jgi:hypothetical protein
MRGDDFGPGPWLCLPTSASLTCLRAGNPRLTASDGKDPKPKATQAKGGKSNGKSHGVFLPHPAHHDILGSAKRNLVTCLNCQHLRGGDAGQVVTGAGTPQQHE